MEKLKKNLRVILGIIIGGIVKIYKEIVENFVKILEEFRKFQDMENIRRNFRTVILETLGEILIKCEYQTSFGKIRRIFLDFSISFGKSSICEGSSEKY